MLHPKRSATLLPGSDHHVQPNEWKERSVGTRWPGRTQDDVINSFFSDENPPAQLN
jgi:hypothetical protein